MTPQTEDRVRAHTAPHINRLLDAQAAERVEQYARATAAELTARIDALDREWDMERVLEVNASALAMTGLMLGLMRERRWFVLPALVLPFLFLHAVQGWCPPVPLLRRLGVRTRKEIDCEKYALKALRGDFSDAAAGSPAAAFEAARS